MKRSIFISSLFVVFMVLEIVLYCMIGKYDYTGIIIVTTVLNAFCLAILILWTISLIQRNKFQKASSEKSRFLSEMSHDIRTPMNGIMGMTLLAKNNIENKDTAIAYLNKIMETSTHLLRLINEVLDISRIESGKTVLKYDSINLLDSIDICYDIAYGQAIENNIHLTKKVNITNPYVVVDDLHLRQILINILGNAIKFSKVNGTVLFDIEEKKIDGLVSRYIFTIEDSGCGMEKSFLNHIFEPFVQENAMKNSSGLGMAIVKRLVDLMGGTIHIDSKKNVGSRFIITLDLEIGQTERKILDQPLDLSILKGKRILLVEDNDINREIAVELLSNVGIIVDTAVNGEEAIEKYNPNYDIILMDMIMPVLDGLEATKQIRKIDKSIVIICMTANVYEDDKTKSQEAGMNDYIIKPFDINKVYQTLIQYCKDK